MASRTNLQILQEAFAPSIPVVVTVEVSKEQYWNFQIRRFMPTEARPGGEMVLLGSGNGRLELDNELGYAVRDPVSSAIRAGWNPAGVASTKSESLDSMLRRITGTGMSQVKLEDL